MPRRLWAQESPRYAAAVAQVSQLYKEQRQLQSRLDQADIGTAALRAEVGLQEQDARRLRGMIRSMEVSLKQARAIEDALEEALPQLGAVARELAEADRFLGGLPATYRDHVAGAAEAAVHQKEEELVALEAEFAQTRADLREEEAKLREEEAKSRGLQELIETLEAQLRKTEKTLEETNDTLAMTRLKLANAERKLSQLGEGAAKKAEELAQLRKDYKAQAEQLSATQNRVEELSAELAKAQEAGQEFQNKLEAAARREEVLTKENEQLRARLEAAEAELTTTRYEKETETVRAGAAVASLRDVEVEFAATVDRLEMELADAEAVGNMEQLLMAVDSLVDRTELRAEADAAAAVQAAVARCHAAETAAAAAEVANCDRDLDLTKEREEELREEWKVKAQEAADEARLKAEEEAAVQLGKALMEQEESWQAKVDEVEAELEEVKQQSAQGRALLLESEAREAALLAETTHADADLAACEQALGLEQAEHNDTRTALATSNAQLNAVAEQSANQAAEADELERLRKSDGLLIERQQRAAGAMSIQSRMRQQSSGRLAGKLEQGLQTAGLQGSLLKDALNEAESNLTSERSASERLRRNRDEIQTRLETLETKARQEARWAAEQKEQTEREGGGAAAREAREAEARQQYVEQNGSDTLELGAISADDVPDAEVKASARASAAYVTFTLLRYDDLGSVEVGELGRTTARQDATHPEWLGERVHLPIDTLPHTEASPLKLRVRMWDADAGRSDDELLAETIVALPGGQTHGVLTTNLKVRETVYTLDGPPPAAVDAPATASSCYGGAPAAAAPAAAVAGAAEVAPRKTRSNVPDITLRFAYTIASHHLMGRIHTEGAEVAAKLTAIAEAQTGALIEETAAMEKELVAAVMKLEAHKFEESHILLLRLRGEVVCTLRELVNTEAEVSERGVYIEYACFPPSAPQPHPSHVTLTPLAP